MTFEDLIKTLQEQQEIPEKVDVRGALRVGPSEGFEEDAPVLDASFEATELDDSEIQRLQEKTA